MLSRGPTWARTRDPLIMSQMHIFSITCHHLLLLEIQLIIKMVSFLNHLNLC